MYEVLIKSGFVVDGTGGPWYRADVAISEGKIVNMNSRLPASKADMVIDAKGLVVAPGFFDMHAHSELNLLVYPKAESKIMMGVTTEFNCMCGTSGSGPLKGAALEVTNRQARKQLPELEVDWSTLAEYMERLNKQGCSINSAFQVGHGTVRLCVMGMDNRVPTEEELDEMKELVAQTMEEGAFGMSTGLMYEPSGYAETEEIIELAKVVGKYGGIYTSHIRRRGWDIDPRGGRNFLIINRDTPLRAIRECIKIGEEAGIPTIWSHSKAVGAVNWGEPLKDYLKEFDFARRNGVDFRAELYPYIYRRGLIRPRPGTTWARGKDPSVMLKDPKTRQRIRNFLKRAMETYACAEHTWDGTLILSASEEDKDLIGKTLVEAARIREMEPVDLYLDRLANGNPLEGVPKSMCEDGVKNLLKHPIQMVGSDTRAMPADPAKKQHPRAFGTFPKIIRKYVMEEGVLTLEEAIRKMTSTPASVLGLMDRGLLRPGFWADIIVFDPLNIRDLSTYLEPMRYPSGIEYIFVNGVLTVEHGKHTEALAGKPLKHRSAKDD